MTIQCVTPVWPDGITARSVVAFTTTRAGGVSKGPYGSLNLGAHVQDDESHVLMNRQRLRIECELPDEPVWLNQIHGNQVVHIGYSQDKGAAPILADAALTQERGCICAVLTADCLPIFLCDRQGSAVAMIHVGWRGLMNGIVDSTLRAFPTAPVNILAAFGPCIGFDTYEVGPDVMQALTAGFGAIVNDEKAVRISDRNGHGYINLAYIAAHQLQLAGVAVGPLPRYCTLTESERWFSYRRDGETGRMASVIYLT